MGKDKPTQKKRPFPPELPSQLMEQWERETRIHSNSHIIMRNENCRQLVELGLPVVPYLLKRLEEEHAGLSYCHLLQEITGEDPTPEPQQLPGSDTHGFVGYDVESCVRAWINWGQKHYDIRTRRYNL